MTDEEVEARYRDIAVALAVPYINGVHGPLPPEIDGDISATMWRYGYLPGLDQLIAEGATPEQAARARAEAKALHSIVEEADLVPIPQDLATEIANDGRQFLAEEPDDLPRRLDEVHVKWITEIRVEIYFDEPKHRGFPHVAVILQDGKITVSLESPPRVMTPKGYRGEAAARKIVEKHLVRLLALWHSTRPSTQQLSPKTANAPKATARRSKGGTRKR